MPTFNVHITLTVSTTVDVEASDYAEALELWPDSEQAPGSITHGAFGSGSPVDESGDWTAQVVYDESGKEVWFATD